MVCRWLGVDGFRHTLGSSPDQGRDRPAAHQHPLSARIRADTTLTLTASQVSAESKI